MQYGKQDDDLQKSSLEIIQDLQSTILPTESAESLESLLSHFHGKNQQQLEIEHRAVSYLRSLGLQFKTDPRQKELDYFDKPKKNMIVFQQTIGESPLVGPILISKFGDEGSNSQHELHGWLNPFLYRQKNQSFEL